MYEATSHAKIAIICRLAVDMNIHGYIHVWISDLSHIVDISMDIMLAHLLIKLNTYCLSLKFFLSVVFTVHFLIYLLNEINNQ